MKKWSVKRGVSHLILLVGAFVAVAPFLWMACASVKTFSEVVSSQALLPKVCTLANYQDILERVGFLRAFLNSFLVAVPATTGVVLGSTAMGYVLAKYQFWGKEIVFRLLLSTLMVPFTVVVIPLFLTMQDLGLINKLGGVLVTSLCSTFGIFLMRQTIETIPNDYIDAARIDGASEVWILRQVIAPLARSAIATLAVFTFLGNWDSYMWPSILLKSPSQQTIPVVLAGMQSLFVERYHIWSAGSMLTVIPVMILFTLAQKQFISGLALSGLKG